MPIYAYKCESCGHAKDVLQKMSDAPLVDCPQCGAATFKKQLTSAGFQLKGSGWYVTDFRDGKSDGKSDGKGGADKAKEPGEAGKTAVPATDAAAAPAKSEAATPSAAPAPASATVSSSPAPVPKAAT